MAQNLSLQERCRIQRDKQLRFLREQGLIHYAMDGKGGAGSVLDTASVTSSSFSANGNGGRLNIGSSVVSHRNHLPKSTSASANPTS